MKHAGNFVRAARACRAGAVNQAVVANVGALLFVPLTRLYGFTYLQLGLLTAVCFCSQLLADAALIFLIDRLSRRALSVAASAASCIGLLFFGCVPYVFPEGGVYGGILGAVAVFACAGGMLEVVLSNIADGLPPSAGGMYLQRTVYAWAQAGLAAYLLVFLQLFGAQYWNVALFPLAAIPALLPAFLVRARLPAREKAAPVRSAFRSVYLFAVLAVLFGYGAETAMNQWISSFASEVLGFDAGGMLGCVLFCLCLGAGGAAFVALQRSRGGMPPLAPAVAGLAGAAAYLGAAFFASPALALASAVLCGFFVGVLSPGAMSSASRALPHTGGWMLASLALAQDVGAAALPALMGAASDTAGMRTGFFLSAAAPFLAAAFLFGMRRGKDVLPLRKGGCARRIFRARSKKM